MIVKAHAWVAAQVAITVRFAHLLSALLDQNGAPSHVFVQFLKKYKAEFGKKSQFVYVNALIDCLHRGQRKNTMLPVLDLRAADYDFVLLLDCVGHHDSGMSLQLSPACPLTPNAA